MTTIVNVNSVIQTYSMKSHTTFADNNFR